MNDEELKAKAIALLTAWPSFRSVTVHDGPLWAKVLHAERDQSLPDLVIDVADLAQWGV